MNKLRINKATTIPVLMQVLFCVILFAFPLYIMSRSGELDTGHFLIFSVRTCILILLFYVNYFLLIPKFLFSKRLVSFIGLNLVLALGLLVTQNILIGFILDALQHVGPDDGKIKPDPYMRYWGDMLIDLLVISLSVAVRMTQRWYHDTMNIEILKAAQFEADLRNLRSQLNPHFLFNTLNNIYALIAIDKDKAQDSVLRLSNLLRYILYENNTPYVPICRDLEFTNDYIDLMKLRVGENVKLSVSITGRDSKDAIAPLLFMTLIENAFKHGVSNNQESFIRINILVENAKGVLCTIENSICQGSNIETKNSGIGLANLEKRLELLYPHKHDLHISKVNNCFAVRMRVDF